MNCDSFFAIGYTHTVCQDYAVHGTFSLGPNAGKSYALLGDGCSGSPHTDFGSRFLCHSFRRSVEEEGFSLSSTAYSTLQLASTQVSATLLPKESLDATLLGLLEVEGGVLAFAMGDGAIAGRRRDGGLDVAILGFPRGYPAYPNYIHDEGRLDTYVSLVGEGVASVDEYAVRSDLVEGAAPLTTSTHSFFSPSRNGEPSAYLPFSRFFSSEHYSAVAAFSDGICSFHHHTVDSTSKAPVPVSPLVVLRDLVNFKSTCGEFVLRRAKKHLASLRKDSVYHHDDVSIVSLSL